MPLSSNYYSPYYYSPNQSAKTKQDKEKEARYVYNSIMNNSGNQKDAYNAGRNIVGNSFRAPSDNAYNGFKTTIPKIDTSHYGVSASGGYGFGGGGSLSRIGAFQPSEAYNQAMAYTQSLLDQLNSGKTAYSDKVDALMAKIEGREKFSYDFNTDPLFQNALASAMASGQTAMQDTIGQASALTGGYGSSYATSAANQTYNEFVKGAYDKLPDYYNIALNAYNMEGQEMYNQLGMYREADNTAYSRLANAYNANFQNAESIYNKEYSNYWDTANYNRAVDEFNANMAYKNASLKASAAKNSSALSGSSSNEATTKEYSTAEWQKAYDDIDRAITNYGVNSEQANRIMAYYATQGYDPDRLINYAESADSSTMPTSKVPTLSTSGHFIVNGQANTGVDENFYLVSGKAKSDDAVYEDYWGRQYTYQQLKSRGVDKSRLISK